MKAALKRLRDTSPMMQPLARTLRATGVVPERLWRHLAFTGVADFTVAGRTVKMRHFGAEIENSLFWSGYGHGWEATSLLAWERLAVDAAVVFDVGANSGLFALAAAAANPQATIHAFEPMPAIVDRLRDNVTLNRYPITIHPAAVSDASGTAQIKALMSDHEYSASFEHMDWMDHDEATMIEVPVLRLADVIAQSGAQPDLIKIDVERHEPQALRGLWDGTREDNLPILLIEVLDDATADLVRAEIEPRGYIGMVLREGVGVTAQPFAAVPGTMNWLLVPPCRRAAAGRFMAQPTISHAELLATRPKRA